MRETSSNESLERIHTFSLKTSFQNQNAAPTAKASVEDSKGAYGGETPINNSGKKRFNADLSAYQSSQPSPVVVKRVE